MVSIHVTFITSVQIRKCLNLLFSTLNGRYITSLVIDFRNVMSALEIIFPRRPVAQDWFVGSISLLQLEVPNGYQSPTTVSTKWILDSFGCSTWAS